MSRLAFILGLIEWTYVLALFAKYRVNFFGENAGELFHSRCSLEDAIRARAHVFNTIIMLMVSSLLKWMPGQ